MGIHGEGGTHKIFDTVRQNCDFRHKVSEIVRQNCNSPLKFSAQWYRIVIHITTSVLKIFDTLENFNFQDGELLQIWS